MKNQKAGKLTYSLKKRVFGYFILVLAVFMLFYAGLTRYFSGQMTKKAYKNMEDTLDLYVKQVTQNLDTAEDCLWELSNNNMDVTAMTTGVGQAETAVNETKVFRLLENTLGYLPNIDGMFVFGIYESRYVSSYKSALSKNCNDCLKEKMYSARKGLEEQDTAKWFFLNQEDSWYLVRIIGCRYGYMGAWLELSKLAEMFEESGTEFVYTGLQGTVLSSEKWKNQRFTVEGATDDPQRMIDEEGIEYLQISSLLPFADGYIMALNPVENIQAEINPVIRIMLVAALCLLLAVSFWMISFNHFFSAPIRMLDKISTHIQRGDLTSKPDLSGERCEEVLRIGNALNLLLDEISELKIGIYEDQITRREFELQYLKSQVAPHFLINCLSAVGSMPGTEEGHKMTQQIIQTLSNHLRYTLSERKIVPLSEELYYVENYLQLTAVRFPGYLKWEISVQEECRNASVFPVLLLMFTENMVKHNMIMGEMLNARITAVMRTENKEKYIVMTHLDSGSGYPEEMLQLLNSPVEEQQHDIDGYRMGNYNIIKRLKLMYGEMASVRFSNEAGWGAKTEISIPYRPFDSSI